MARPGGSIEKYKQPEGNMEEIDRIIRDNVEDPEYKSRRDREKAEKKAKHRRALNTYDNAKAMGVPFFRMENVLHDSARDYHTKFIGSENYDYDIYTALFDASMIAMNRRFWVYAVVAIHAITGLLVYVGIA